VPFPVTRSTCGLPTPSLTMVIAAERAPVVDGAKVTTKEQVTPGDRLPLQVDVPVANSDGLLLPTLDIVTTVPPALDRVKVLAVPAAPTV